MRPKFINRGEVNFPKALEVRDNHEYMSERMNALGNVIVLVGVCQGDQLMLNNELVARLTILVVVLYWNRLPPARQISIPITMATTDDEAGGCRYYYHGLC